jgi:Enoyl-CoA hydratase/isomerase
MLVGLIFCLDYLVDLDCIWDLQEVDLRVVLSCRFPPKFFSSLLFKLNHRQAGIATHYVQATQLDALQDELAKVKASNQVKPLLDSFATTPPQDSIENTEAIERCFGAHHKNLESVFATLQADDSPWAKETLVALSRASPTSLRVVFRELREGATKGSIAECFKMEYRIADTFMRPDGPSRDFFEGVRAILVDKDKKYTWVPNNLANVDEAFIRPFFEQSPSGGDLIL